MHVHMYVYVAYTPSKHVDLAVLTFFPFPRCLIRPFRNCVWVGGWMVVNLGILTDCQGWKGQGRGDESR